MSGKGSGNQLKQKLTQKLSMRQIQLMQMVLLPYNELAQRIKEEIEENPALEEGASPDTEIGAEDSISTDQGESRLSAEELQLGDYASEEETPEPLLQQYYKGQAVGSEIPYASEPTLQEYLKEQVLLTSLQGKEVEIAHFIIGSLDSDGYLRRTREGLADDLMIYEGLETSVQEIEAVEKVLQTLDPAGLFARSLNDCLSLQLRRRQKTPVVLLALEILEQHFELFSQRNFSKLKSETEVSDEQLREASQLISALNPSPGLDFSSRLEDTFMAIIPDFEVTAHGEDLQVTLYTAGLPEVRVSRQFEQEMADYTGDLRSVSDSTEKETGRFVKQKIDEARWFVEMLRQRNKTLLETMMAIVELQRDYFLTGDTRHLRPMILKDVAERSNYDISTISRVTSTKFVQTDFGIFPLRHFFSEGTVRDDGTEVSTRQIRELLTQLIAGEDKRTPLSDDALSEKLKEKGYNVARRTIAKYRDQLKIPIARLRKEI